MPKLRKLNKPRLHLVENVSFDVPSKYASMYLEVLEKYYAENEKFSDPKAKALLVFDNLKWGLKPGGGGWRSGSKSFDDRVKHVTKGLWKGTDETSQIRGIVTTEAASSSSYSPVSPDVKALMRFLDSTEIKQYEERLSSLLSQYPDLNRPDIIGDVRTFCKMSAKLAKLVDLGGTDSSVKNFTDSVIKLGEYLGISEKKRMEQMLSEKKENLAALSVRFEKTVEKFPEIVKRMRLKELRILVNKHERGELPDWLFQHPSHAGMPLEKAKEILKQERV